MDVDDFIKLPASEASSLYRQHRVAGDVEEASRLHQAYFEAHRVKLSDDRQIADAARLPLAASAADERAKRARKPERSKVRAVGALLSGMGLVMVLFALAAGIGPAAFVVAGCMASGGLALWLVGILEDRLLMIHRELVGTSAAP